MQTKNKMKIIIDDTKRLSVAMSMAREFNDFVTFAVEETCLRASILDATHVSVTILSIRARVTDRDISSDAICIKTDDMVKLLALSHGEPMTIETIETGIHICIGKIEANMRVFDMESEDMNIDSYDPDGTYRVSAREFFGHVKDLTGFGDTVTVTPGNSTMELRTKGDLGTVAIGMDAQGSADVGPSSYALRYLMSLSKAASLVDTVRLDVSNEMPLRIMIESDDIDITFFLAPKMEDADDDDA